MGKSRYTYEERLAIGCRIYNKELNRFQAAAQYQISVDSARNYMRMYRAVAGIAAQNTDSRNNRHAAGCITDKAL